MPTGGGKGNGWIRGQIAKSRVSELPLNTYDPSGAKAIATSDVFERPYSTANDEAFVNISENMGGTYDTMAVPVKEIVPGQSWLTPETLQHAMQVPEDHPAYGVRMPDGNVLLTDGHHGVAAQILKGAYDVPIRMEG